MKSQGNLFWDSCVFIRYLTGQIGDPYFEEIAHYVDEAKAGGWTIHFSTIAFAEIRPKHLRKKGFFSISDFLADLGGAFIPIDPNPNIMIDAGELRDANAVNPSDPNISADEVRVVGTADAIHLCTCIYAKDVLGITDIVFHTLDEGKGKSWEGKCIPLLTFEDWYPAALRPPKIKDACDLIRKRPLHPQPFIRGTISTSQAPFATH